MIAYLVLKLSFEVVKYDLFKENKLTTSDFKSFEFKGATKQAYFACREYKLNQTKSINNINAISWCFMKSSVDKIVSKQNSVTTFGKLGNGGN